MIGNIEEEIKKEFVREKINLESLRSLTNEELIRRQLKLESITSVNSMTTISQNQKYEINLVKTVTLNEIEAELERRYFDEEIDDDEWESIILKIEKEKRDASIAST